MMSKTRITPIVLVLLCVASLASAAVFQPLGIPEGSPDANVPPPKPFTLDDAPTVPLNWGFALMTDPDLRLEFQIDLDYLAPLGDGTINSAVYFAPFNKQDGVRRGEWEAANANLQDWDTNRAKWRILPPQAPLLLEAEPWVDQAECRFYPEILPYQGWQTTIPNLLHSITLGRSWVARGQSLDDPDAALDDFRKTVRLGRLLLQDDVTAIQNLIGVALVRIGTEAIYQHAVDHGDALTTALCALVINDANAIRMDYARRLADVPDFGDFETTLFGYRLTVSDDQLGEFVTQARSAPAQALQIEVLTAVAAIAYFGTDEQRDTARSVLEELQSSQQPIIAAAAAYYLGEGIEEELTGLIEDFE